MNTKLKLNTLLLASVLLAPFAYADGARTQSAIQTDSTTFGATTPAVQTPDAAILVAETASVQRTVLQQLAVDVRQDLLQRLQVTEGLSALVREALPALTKALGRVQ